MQQTGIDTDDERRIRYNFRRRIERLTFENSRAGNSSGKEIIRIAANVDQAVFHRACGISANIAMHGDSTIFHGKPEIGADITVYRDAAAVRR